MVLRKIPNGSSKKVRNALNNFLEFFVIQPVSLDPFGIIRKFEHLLLLAEKRFKYFVGRIAPELSEEERQNLIMAISGTMNLYQIQKNLRHFIEFIKKTRNLQYALLLQMQLPLLKRISKALHKGVEAFVNGWSVGDSIGALVAAHLIGDSPVKEIEEDTLVAEREIEGKRVIIIKAKGPGGRLGKIGRAVEKVLKRRRVSKIITIDAALKLEGERTGSVAQGIGVAIGGIGVDKAYIENLATKYDIPVDSIIIKMSQEEAIMPMKKEILEACDKVLEMVREDIKETKGRTVLIVGVGNSCGVGNNKKEAEEAKKRIAEVYEKLKSREGYFEEEVKKRWYDTFFPGFVLKK